MSPSTSNLQMRNKLQVLSFLGPSPSAHPQPLHGHSLGMRSSLALPSPPPPRVSQPVPEQVCEPTCRRGPQEVGQRVEIPDVELVVERTAEADTNEVGGEEGRNYLYAVVKAKGRSRRGRRWGWRCGRAERFQSRGVKGFGSDSPLTLLFLEACLWASFLTSLDLLLNLTWRQ